MYTIGDAVKIKSDLLDGNVFDDCYFIKNMEKYRGEITQIKGVYANGRRYTLDVDHGRYAWTSDMLESINPRETDSSLLLCLYKE